MPGFGTWSKSIVFMVKTFAVCIMESDLEVVLECKLEIESESKSESES